MITKFNKQVAAALKLAQATNNERRKLPVEDSLTKLKNAMTTAYRDVILFGNGGSCAIASHIALDYHKSLRCRVRTLNDPAMITMLGNDVSFDAIYETQLRRAIVDYRTVIAISSSGESKNVLDAARYARMASGLSVFLVTFTGMKPSNKLRKLGHLNFYVPSMHYGVVECAHLMLLHSLVDL